MRIKFESKGGFDNVLKWIDKTSSAPLTMAKKIGDYGDARLMSGTPMDTGETASAWTHNVDIKNNSIEVSWINTAHPESETNVAKLIELGHGTGTGGYVAPRPYIKQAMAPVWSKIDKDMRELMK